MELNRFWILNLKITSWFIIFELWTLDFGESGRRLDCGRGRGDKWQVTSYCYGSMVRHFTVSLISISDCITALHTSIANSLWVCKSVTDCEWISESWNWDWNWNRKLLTVWFLTGWLTDWFLVTYHFLTYFKPFAFAHRLALLAQSS